MRDTPPSQAALYAMDGTPIGMCWLLGFTALVTLGELHLSPVGLSLVAKLAPAQMVCLFMGLWFLGQFVGNLGAGSLGGFWEPLSRPRFFALIAAKALTAALPLAALLRPLNRIVTKHRP